MATSPTSQRENPKRNNSLRDFQGVNTQAARQVIGDNQFAWLENVMPIGFGNMPCVPGPSASLATWTGTAYRMHAFTLTATPYMLVLCTNGAAYQVNLTNYAVTTVAAAATLNGSHSEVAQWSYTNIVIVDPTKGYFSWDGATLTKYNGTLQSLTITAIGTGYTTVPTIGGFGTGGGSGGAATCDIQVGLATVTAAGTLYNVGDIVTVSGGTKTRAATLRVTATTAGGVISGINLIDAGDYTVAPANPAATTSPYGSGCTLTLNFGIGPITLTTVGSGYTSQPALTVTGGGGTGGAVTGNLSVVPPAGTSVATYAGRVWVASGRTISFSAPGSFSDFSTTSAGGSFIVTDETLQGPIVALYSANNFLYILGASSVNVIADVNVSNGVTVFSNTNISASVGTPYEYCAFPYYRGLWFANTYGIYAVYGSTTQKLSDDLDGIYPFLKDASNGGFNITLGAVVLFEILCLAFLANYNDPVRGQRSLLMIFFNKKWFFCSQGDTLTLIESSVVSGSQALFATTGSNLYKILSDPTVSVPQKVVTKLWDMGQPLDNKQAIKFGLEVFDPLSVQSFDGTVDTEYTNGSVPFLFYNFNIAIWINNAQQVVLWSGNISPIVSWLATGYDFLTTDIQTVGRYLGATVNSSSTQTLYEGMHLEYEVRTKWPQPGVM